MSISKGLAESAVVAKAPKVLSKHSNRASGCRVDAVAAISAEVIYKEPVESLKQCVVADVEEDRNPE